MFGGRKVDRVTMLNVTCEVESRHGKRAKGFASMAKSPGPSSISFIASAPPTFKTTKPPAEPKAIWAYLAGRERTDDHPDVGLETLRD